MVTSVVKALLLQAFLAVHVHATLSAADLSEAHDVLNKLLKEEAGQLCGSDEIYKILSKTSTNRVVEWKKINGIRNTKIEELNAEMKKTKEKIEEKQQAIANFERNSRKSATLEDVTPWIEKALAEGFQEEVSNAVQIAACSMCGSMGPDDFEEICEMVNSEMYHFEREDPTMDEASVEAFEKILETNIETLNKKIDPEVVDAACQATLSKLSEEALSDVSYCPEMCTQISEKGLEVSNAHFAVTVGGLDELKTELERLIALGKDLSDKSLSCQEAGKILEDFEKSLKPLEESTKKTFTVWKKANMDLQKAQSGLKKLNKNIDAQEAEKEKLKTALDGTTEKLKNELTNLLKLTMANSVLNKKNEETMQAAKEAKDSMASFLSAVNAALRIKEGVEGVLKSVRTLYDSVVNEFLRNAGIDFPECRHDAPENQKNECLPDFNPNSEGYKTSEKKKLLTSMDELTTHCVEKAKPAFQAVAARDPSIDLTPLCDFTGYDLKESVLAVVDKHRTKADGLIKDTILKYREMDTVIDTEEANENMRAPGLLIPVMTEFPDISFSKTYLPDWGTQQRFLKAIQSLRDIHDETDRKNDELDQKIEELKADLEQNGLALKNAKVAVQEAKASNELAADQYDGVLAILSAMDDTQKKMEIDLEALKKARQVAKEAYDGAKNEFETVFKAGVSQSFLQKGELPSISSLKPIKRLD